MNIISRIFKRRPIEVTVSIPELKELIQRNNELNAIENAWRELNDHRFKDSCVFELHEMENSECNKRGVERGSFASFIIKDILSLIEK